MLIIGKRIGSFVNGVAFLSNIPGSTHGITIELDQAFARR